MFKTGNSSMDYLLIAIISLPLLPALLIFGRRLYLQEPLNFLLIICLLSFFKGVLGIAWPLTEAGQFLLNKLFSLALLLLLIPCFRGSLAPRNRYVLDLSLSALLALAITFWSLRGWGNASPGIDMLLNGFSGVLILVSLPSVVQNGALQVFSAPLFWIGAGSLFYILLYFLLEGVGGCCQPVSLAPDPDKHIFLVLAELVKFSFYGIAALSTKPSLLPPRVQ